MGGNRGQGAGAGRRDCGADRDGVFLARKPSPCVATLLESTPRLVAHAAAWADTWKREKLENLALLLTGALQASGKVGLKMNLPADKLEQVTARLPALHTPTISHLLGGDWIAIEVIVDAAVVP